MKDWLDRPPRSSRDWLWLMVAGAVLWILVGWLPGLMENVWVILRVLTPFAGGLVLAYVLDIPTRFFAQKLFRGKRGPSIALAYAAFFGALVVLLGLVVPQLFISIGEFINSFPAYVQNLYGMLETLEQEFGINLDTLNELLEDSGELAQQMLNKVASSAPQLAGAVAGAASSAMDVFVSLAVSIYLLTGKEKLLQGARATVRAALPPRMAGNVMAVCTMANKTFCGYIGGQLLDAALVGLETFLLMTILRIPYAPLIAVLVGVTNIIPIMGPFIGAVPSAVILLLSGNFLQAVEFVIIILVVQQVDGNFIAPRILGDATGISGLGVMLAILVGGELFGIPGMVIGVPTLAVVMTLLRQGVAAGLTTRGIDADGNPLPKE